MKRGTPGYRALVWGLRVAALAIIIGLWLFGNGPGHVSVLLLPDFGKVWVNFGMLFVTPLFWSNLWVTLYSFLISFGISAVLGTLLGFWAARRPLRARVVEPVAVWGYMAPLVLFYPLFVLWLGVSPQSRILLATIASIFPIVYGSIRAFRSVDDIYLRLGAAYGASQRQIDWLIKLRASLPVLSSGYRVGAAYSVTGILATEILASTNGLGNMLSTASQLFNGAQSYALLIAIVCFVALMQLGLNRLFATRYGPNDD